MIPNFMNRIFRAKGKKEKTRFDGVLTNFHGRLSLLLYHLAQPNEQSVHLVGR
jgi:hypothetical protein